MKKVKGLLAAFMLLASVGAFAAKENAVLEQSKKQGGMTAQKDRVGEKIMFPSGGGYFTDACGDLYYVSWSCNYNCLNDDGEADDNLWEAIVDAINDNTCGFGPGLFGGFHTN